MLKALHKDAVEQYKREGYYFPLTVLDDEQVAANRKLLEDFETRQGEPIGGALRSKSHLLFTWVDDLMRHPKIFLGQGSGQPEFRFLAPGPALLGPRQQRPGQRVAGAVAGNAGKRLHACTAGQSPGRPPAPQG